MVSFRKRGVNRIRPVGEGAGEWAIFAFLGAGSRRAVYVRFTATRMISYFRGPRSRAQGGNKRKGGCQMFQGHIDQDTATQVAVSAVPDGLFERGLYWASGRSGVVNLVAAHKWLNLAAMKGRADAIRLRREVAELTSDVEIATAQREARTWMTAH
jgi:hypothetical protein